MDVLDKVKILPPDKQREVEDFVDFLLSKYINHEPNNPSLSEKRSNNLGWAKGTVGMASDFNETPEAFKDYL